MTSEDFWIGAWFRCGYRRLYRWATHRLYRELAWAYEAIAWIVSLGHWDDWRRQVLDYVEGERLLEIGFGTGKLLAAAADRGLTMWGIDPSSAMHRVAIRTLRRRQLVVSRMRAAAQALPFPTGIFDTVISTFPADYIADPKTLREVARILRCWRNGTKGGRFVVTGLGFRAGAGWQAKVMGAVFGGHQQDVVSLYARFAERHGFSVTVVDDGPKSIRVPVLILEVTEEE